MTHVINLFGAPGSGKSSNSAALFSKLKAAQVNCELVSEYVKSWAWSGRTVATFDQALISGKQISRESILYGKVDVVITDSPVWLSAFYQEHYTNKSYVLPMVKGFIEHAEENGVQYHNFFIERTKAYNPKGRYETEEQARALDGKMHSWLEGIGLDFKMVNEESLQEIYVGSEFAIAEYLKSYVLDNLNV